MPEKKDEYYVNKKELFDELLKFKNTNVITNELGQILINIANKFAMRNNFIGYTYRDEFIQDAIVRMVAQVGKINLDHPKCNPFSYFTQICFNCFRARINKEKKHQTAKENLQNSVYDEFEISEHLDSTPHNQDIED